MTTPALVTASVRGEAALSAVHPDLVAAVAALRAMPHPPGVVGWAIGHGPRDSKEQSAAVKAGTSKAAFGRSPHNWRVPVGERLLTPALDVYPLVLRAGKRVVSGTPEHYTAIGKAAEAAGVEWGGAWTGFVDRPHLQVPGWRAMAGLAP